MALNSLSVMGRIGATACASILLASLVQPVFAVSGGNIYKYVDNNGRTVFNSSIPAEYVKNGYTVLNDHGQVIQQVPRALSTEELAHQQASKAAEQQAITSRVAQAEADKLLIRLYRTAEDVTKKRDVALLQLKTQQDLVKLNLTKSESEIVRVQGIIDNNIKAGRQPPGDVVKKMEQARSNKEKFEAQSKKQDADREKLMADAERDSKRLRELMGQQPAAAAEAKP